MAKTKLIPGFRFHPTDVELVKYYLKRKVMGKKSPVEVIAEVELYKYAPWDLPDKSFLRDGDSKWYFFCPKGKKYASGARVNRATEVGYWKTTGKDRSVHHNDQIVGMIKTLVFHMGRPPGGDRTDWVMHEFRLEDKELTDKGIPQDSYVLCRVFQKDGRGPRNGAQYGKPYNEEDWDDDEEGIDCVEAVPLAAVSAPVPNLPIAHNSSAATDMNLSTSGCIGSSSMSYLSGLMPSPCLMHHSIPSDQVISNDVSQVPVDDDIILMMNCFTDDNTLALNGNNKIEKVDNSGQQKDVEVPCLIGGDIFKGLGDLDNLVGLNEEGNDCTWGQKAGYTTSQMPFMGDVSFLELLDLDFPFQHESCGRSDPEHEGLAIEKGETEKRENSCK